MPAGLSPFKQHTSAPGALRLEMCSCFHALEEGCGHDPAAGSQRLGDRAGRCRDAATTRCSRWKSWPEDYPGAQLYLAIGSDMLLSFDGWHRWQDILRLAHLVVTSRNVGDARSCTQRLSGWTPPGHASCLHRYRRCPWPAATSAPVWLQAKGVKRKLPEAVRAVIRREKLYKKKEVSANEPQTGKGACARPLER